MNNFASVDYNTWCAPGTSPSAPRGLHGGRAAILIKDVRLLGIRVTARAVLNIAEHDRRQALGLGGVVDPDLLDRLLDLPTTVPLADAAVWAELQGQVPGIVKCDQGAGTTTRLLESPLIIEEVIVRAASGRELHTVQDASLFAGFTRRSVMALREFIPEAGMLEAKLCGVGVRDRSGAVVLASEPAVRPTLDGWSWLLQEKAYGQWLRQRPEDHVLASPCPATGGASVIPEP